jgi:alanine racemase
MIVATIGAGYADGYPRDLSGKAYVEIAGSLAPLVGRVSMDVITVDISALTPTQRSAAQQACLIGAHYSASQMAADTHTISYEILTGLGARLLRLYDTA